MSSLLPDNSSISSSPQRLPVDDVPPCARPLSPGSPGPSPTLPPSTILPPSWQTISDKCTAPCAAGIQSALIDVSKVLQSIDSHLAGLMMPAMDAIAQTKGACSGQCQCCMDDCAGIVDRVTQKVLANVYGLMAQAQQYCAQLGAVPRAPTVAAPASPALPEITTTAPPSSPTIPLLPGSPAPQAPVNLLANPPGSPQAPTGAGAVAGAVAQATAQAQATAGATAGAWAAALAQALAQAGATANATAVAAAVSNAIAKAVADATARTTLAQPSPSNLVASVHGGSIVISPQTAPINLRVQCFSEIQLDQLIRILELIYLCLCSKDGPKRKDLESTVPDLTGTSSEPSIPTVSVPVKAPAFDSPAGTYEIVVPQDTLS